MPLFRPPQHHKIPIHPKVGWLLLKKLQQEGRAIAALVTVLFAIFIGVDYQLEPHLFWETMLPLRLIFIIPSLLFILFYHHPIIYRHIQQALLIYLAWLLMVMTQIVFSVEHHYEYSMGWSTVFVGIGVFIVWKPRYLLYLLGFNIVVALIHLSFIDNSDRITNFLETIPLYITMIMVAFVITMISYRSFSRQFTLILELNQRERTLRKQNGEMTRMRQQREEVERIMRHDLKNQLHTMLNIPRLILKHYQMTARHSRLLHSIEGSAGHMLEMINLSLDLHKIERGSYPYNPQPLDIVALIERVEGEMELLAQQKQITFLNQVDGALHQPGVSITIYAEKLLTHALLNNLLKNAIEASPSIRIITVAINRRKEKIDIRITNHGEVPVEIRTHFFEKYMTHGKQRGTGLGTYSAQLFTQVQGGTIELDCETSGYTSINLSLPTPR